MTSMLHKLHLEFEDGHAAELEVDSETTVLSAALDNGLNLAHQCQSGSCTSCLAVLVEGATEAVAGRGSSLLPSEYASGSRLLCSTYARSDARFRLPYPSALINGPQPGRHAVTVWSVRQVGATAVELVVKLPEASDFTFRPGQYARLRVPGTDAWRSYSMASTPGEQPLLTFLVKLLDRGAMTDYLRAGPAVGSDLELDGPFGTFLLNPAAPAYVMVAGGTGLAPLLSMVDALRMRRGAKPRITLCFACEREQDLFYADELELRSFWMPGLDLRIAVTTPRAEYCGRVGTPVMLIEPGDFRDGAEAYVCGPPGMIEAALARLGDLGFSADTIHSERFVSSER